MHNQRLLTLDPQGRPYKGAWVTVSCSQCRCHFNIASSKNPARTMFLSGGTQLSQAVPRSVYGLALSWTHISLQSKFSTSVLDVLVISFRYQRLTKLNMKSHNCKFMFNVSHCLKNSVTLSLGLGHPVVFILGGCRMIHTIGKKKKKNISPTTKSCEIIK